MEDRLEVYIPTSLAVNKNTKYHRGKSAFVKFTIWLKEDTDDLVIDYCYTKRDLEIFGPETIEKTIIHHFQNHKILLYPYYRLGDYYLYPSDFEHQDHLVIRDIYYPEDMKLPPYCG